VERAERLLRAEGFRQLRVREHGDCARIEVEAQDIGRLLDDALRERIVAGLRECGYAFVSLDLEGFSSGKLNRLVPAEEREDGRPGARQPIAAPHRPGTGMTRLPGGA
jgi:uncharacterized protein